MTYVPGLASVFRKKNLRSRMSEIGQRHPTACFPGTGAKPIIRLARRQWWKNASAEGTKRGVDRSKGISKREVIPFIAARTSNRWGDKMVKGANRVVSSVLSEFLKGTFLRAPLFSLICLFVPNSFETKRKRIRFLLLFNLKKKKKLNDNIDAKSTHPRV